MLNALRVVWASIKQIWEDMLALILMNLLTTFFQVLIITGPGAWMALNAVCNRCANGYAISWDHYWTAFKANFWRAWKYALPANIVTIMILVNFIWYPNTFGRQDWVVWVQGAWLAVALFWIAIQLYVAAFYTEQEAKSWRTALRNTVVVAGANPIFTLTLLVITAVAFVAALLLLPPIFAFLGLVWWTMVGNTAVVDRVRSFREREEEQLKKTSKKNRSTTR